jgi:CIC family chloride channel protein
LIVFELALSTVFLSVGVVTRFAPEASGSGIPHLKAVLLGLRPFRWIRVLVIKLTSMLIGGSAGLAAAFNSPLAGLVFVLEELDSRCSSFEFFSA